MYYIVYKVTNNLNGKVYIGSHKTSDLDDGYMGSGKVLKYAQAKHGITNFTKDILFVYDTPEQMYAKESELVNTDFITRDDTYNVMVGGCGGFDHINSTPEIYLSQRRLNGVKNNAKCQEAYISKLANDKHFKEKMRIHAVANLHKIRDKYPFGAFKGKTHTDEYKKRMSEIMSVKQSGTRNSQYGTMWITNGTESIKIKKDVVIPDGWYKGRKQNTTN